MYTDCSESEQKHVSVEFFINAFANSDVVQKLLEEHPQSLAKAYEIAHSFEATQRASLVTQLMQPGLRNAVEPRARTTTIRKHSDIIMGEAIESTAVIGRIPRANQQWQLNNNKAVKTNWNVVTCHNCSGVGHIRKNYASPRKLRTPGPSNLVSTPDTNKATTCNPRGTEDMLVQILILGIEMYALLDSGARRNVLPLHHFNSIPTKLRPPLELSTAIFLQAIVGKWRSGYNRNNALN